MPKRVYKTESRRTSGDGRRRVYKDGSKPKEKGHGGVLGFAGNLAGDVGNTIVGLGPGLVKTGEAIGHDVAKVVGKAPGAQGYAKKASKEGFKSDDIAKDIAGSYAYTYGPAIHGDFGTTASRIYKHPLGPILDVLTVASGGLGAAGKVSSKLAVAGKEIELTTASGKTVSKLASQQRLRAAGQILTDKALKKTSPTAPVFGEAARAAKIEKRQAHRAAVANERFALRIDTTLKRLKKIEHRNAAYLLATLPDPKALDAYVTQLKALPDDFKYKTEANAAVEIINRARPAYDAAIETYQGTPTKLGRRIIAVRDAMEEIAAKDRSIKGSLLRDDTAENRPYLHLRLALKETPDVRASFASQNGNAQHLFDRLSDEFGLPPSEERIIREAERITKQNAPIRDGMPSVESLRGSLEQQGLPQPVYTPDVQTLKPGAKIRYGGGGGARQNLPSSLKQNEGVLFTFGRAIMDPNVLTAGYLRTVKFAHYSDLYNRVLEGGVWIPKGEAIPKGYERVPQPARPFVATLDGKEVIVGRSAEKVSKLDTTVADFDEWAKTNLGDDFEVGEKPQALVDAFKKVSRDDESMVGSYVRDAETGLPIRHPGEILIAPKSYMRSLRGEFTRASTFVYYMNKYPLRVWRALVLNLRPAWLVNNILGNTLMFAVHADARGLKEIGSGLLRMTKSPEERAAFERLMEETFPTQEHGTFIETQAPELGRRSQKALTVLGAGLAKVDRAYERALRRASVRAKLKANPQLRARATGMKQETHQFYDWARKELSDDPKLVDQIEDSINTALGDFNNLSRVEREYIRSVFPFYAWYRAITAVTLKLPLERPLRTVLLAQIGQIGAEGQNENYPLNLRGLFPLEDVGPDGRQRVINTAPVNPFQTTNDVGRMIAALAAGKPGEIGPAVTGVNPFLLGPLEAYFGARASTGGPVRGRGVLESTLQGILEGLPPARLAEAAKAGGAPVPFLPPLSRGDAGNPTLYDRSFQEELLRFLGAPTGRISPSRAEELGER